MGEYKFLKDLMKDFNIKDKYKILLRIYMSMNQDTENRETWINLLNHELGGSLLGGYIDGTVICLEALKRERPVSYHINYLNYFLTYSQKIFNPSLFDLTGNRKKLSQKL